MFIWGTKLKIALGAIIFLSLIGWHYLDRYRAVEAARTALIEQYRVQMQDEVIKAQKTEIELRKKAEESNRRKDERIKELNSRLSALSSSLSNRPSRNEYDSTTPGVAGACTGAELSREDGEFLAGEAARADRVLTERDYYYEQYERARRSLAPDKRSNVR